MQAIASWPPQSVGAWLLAQGWRIEAETEPGAPSMPRVDQALVLAPPGSSRPRPRDNTSLERLLAAVDDDGLRLPPASFRTGGRWAPSSLLLAPIAEGAAWSGDLRALVAPPPPSGLLQWLRDTWPSMAADYRSARVGDLEARMLRAENDVEDESLDRTGVLRHQLAVNGAGVHEVVEPIAWADLHAPSAEAIASIDLWWEATAATAARALTRDPAPTIELVPLSRWLAEWTAFGPPAPRPAPIAWSGTPRLIVITPWQAARRTRTWAVTAALRAENLVIELEERRQGVRVCIRDGDTIEELYRNEAMLGHQVSGSDALMRALLQRLGDALEDDATAARFAWPADDDQRIDHDWRIQVDAFTTDAPSPLGPLAERLVQMLGGTLTR